MILLTVVFQIFMFRNFPHIALVSFIVYCYETLLGFGVFNASLFPFAIILNASFAMSFIILTYTIFLYRQRPLQARLSVLAAVLFVLWYPAVLLVNKLMMPSGLQFDVVNIWGALPAVSAILCLMARKGIMDDERLVRAADRIR